MVTEIFDRFNSKRNERKIGGRLEKENIQLPSSSGISSPGKVLPIGDFFQR